MPTQFSVEYGLGSIHSENQTYSVVDENMFGLVQFWLIVSVR